MELSVSGVTKRFGNLVAVNNCSLKVPSDRIFALIGPNGSGKTTLFNVITGFLSPEAGKVPLDEPTAGIEPAKIQSIVAQIKEVHKMGAGVFIIEHNMSVTMNLADHIYVLNSGVKIAEGPPRQIQSDERVIDAYFGRARST